MLLSRGIYGIFAASKGNLRTLPALFNRDFVANNSTPQQQDENTVINISQSKMQQLKTEMMQKRFVYSESTKKLETIDSRADELKAQEKKLQQLPEGETQSDKPSGIRLSKHLSRLGISSRRQAEKLIKAGMVYVNRKKADMQNMIVPTDAEVSIYTPEGTKTPIKESARIWLFFKPRGMICTHSDPMKRPTIFEYIKSQMKTETHIMSIGRLDYNSEGLILLTNDGDIAHALESPSSNIKRVYRVRVYGTLDEEKLEKIRKGVVINGVQYGPFWVDIENRQTSNTWLKITMSTGKNREIRRVMQKFSLWVNRLQRVSYGQYQIGNLQPGEIREAPILPQIRKLNYMLLRAKLKEKRETAREEQLKIAERSPHANTLTPGSPENMKRREEIQGSKQNQKRLK